MTRLKKLLASVLALTCLLSTMSLPALAVEGTEPTTAVEAMADPADAEDTEAPAAEDAEDTETPADTENVEAPADAEEETPADAEKEEAEDTETPAEVNTAAPVAISETRTALTQFESKSGGTITPGENGAITLSKLSGDHHALLTGGATYKNFVYEADVELGTGDESVSAALLFGVKNTDNIGELWYGANINKSDNAGRIFRVGEGAGDIFVTGNR